MLSLTVVKKYLERNGEYFSDEELKIIRDGLYQLAEIQYLMMKGSEQTLPAFGIN